MFFLGVITGILLFCIVSVVTYVVVSKPSVQDFIKKTVTKIEEPHRQKMSIIKAKTPQEEAYAEILKLNESRGGVPDSEINK